MEYWRGYKLHLSVIDGDIPISAILTSARTHDSQVAIPLMQMSAQRVTDLGDLMDAAYDAEAIHAFSRSLGHVPLIEPVQRGGWIPLDEAQRQRFGQRSASERVNGRLKDFFGGRTVRVRGPLDVRRLGHDRAEPLAAALLNRQPGAPTHHARQAWSLGSVQSRPADVLCAPKWTDTSRLASR
jgi:Transposase DDE domain